MIGCYNKSVLLTYLGAATALLGVAFAWGGALRPAMLCLVLAGLCDLFDGVVARRCHRSELERAFGVQIDSLVDVVSFLALPAVLCLAVAGAGWLPGAVVYVLCGVIRLAWFNLHADSEGPVDCYTGLPVTYAALVLPIGYVLLAALSLPGWLFGALFPALALLFVLPLRLPKPRGVWYILFPALALGVMAALAVL